MIRTLQWLFNILFGHIDDIYIYTDLYIYVRFTTSVIFEIYYSDVLMTRKILYRVIDVTDSYIICSHQLSHFLVFSILYLNGWKFWKILWYRFSAASILRGQIEGSSKWPINIHIYLHIDISFAGFDSVSCDARLRDKSRSGTFFRSLWIYTGFPHSGSLASQSVSASFKFLKFRLNFSHPTVLGNTWVRFQILSK